MNLFELPWNAILAFEGLLFVLLVREAVLTFQLHASHPERGMAWFNAVILVFLLVAIFAGSSVLYLRVGQLASSLPLYPGARYAPERELLMQDQGNVFVTYDSTDVIRRFYEELESKSGWKVTMDDGVDAVRVLFQKDNEHFFLTVVNIGDTRLLFYGRQGEVTVTQVNGR